MREFMDDDEVRDPVELPSVCRYLRTKNAFGTQVGYQPWQLGRSTTAAYWCLQTMSSSGPDDGLAAPEACCAGRGCYQSRSG